MTTTPSILHHTRTDRARSTFYPTPQALADKLLEGINLHFIQGVLEPSAGNGDLANAYAQKRRNWVDRSLTAFFTLFSRFMPHKAVL